MSELERIRKEIVQRLALDFFVRCLRLSRGTTVLDEANKEVDWLFAVKVGNRTLKELIEEKHDN